MNRRLFILAFLLMLLSLHANAQLLYSHEFSAAVEAGNRTNSGVPGPNYKNNYSQYKIDAQFDPATAMLSGEEVVSYSFNTHNGRTRYIYLNLYRNIYKKGVPRHRECDPADITDDGVVIESVQILRNGAYADAPFSYTDTKAKVELGESITSGSKVTLKVKWHVKIAALTHHRGGKYYENSWFVPYWYPQIAVFDDLYGWDLIEHTANEEFLLEFADYDVNITLGDRLMCWATGELQNLKDIYSAPIVGNYNKVMQTGDLVSIVNSANRKSALRKDVNTWHFNASNVPDFVFCCSGEMDWSARSFQIPGQKTRTVAGAVFSHADFAQVIGWTQKTIDYLSTERPAYVYPYPHMTIFEGSGGMEFPMMVNEDFDNRYDSDFFTTSHEVTHSYFPFITGMYQNRYAFMDEGLTQFVPQYFQNKNFRNKDVINDALRCMRYTAGTDDNVPIMTPSYSQTNLWIYTVNSYWKPQMAYTVLEDAVGADNMTRILHDFTHAWAGKHPHPFDFFNMCEKVSGKDLKELIHSWFCLKGYPDLALVSASGREVVVRNVGDILLPVVLNVKYADGSQETVRNNALIWNGGKRQVTISLPKDVSSVELGEAWIPDFDLSNNNL